MYSAQYTLYSAQCTLSKSSSDSVQRRNHWETTSCVHGREGGKTRAAASCGSFALLLSFITSSLRFSLFALSQHPIFLLRIQACVKRQNERGVRTLEGRPNEIFYECIKYWLLDLDLPSMHRPFFYNKIETPEKGSSRDEPPFVVLSKYYFKLPTWSVLLSHLGLSTPT